VTDTDKASQPPLSRGEARRARFLEAASEVFIEHGYGGASVNEVVRRAGGSLATLYQQFQSKELLFLAVLQEGVDAIVADVSSLASQDAPLELGLRQFAEGYLKRILSPIGIAVSRVMITEGHRYPELAQRFREAGPERVEASLAAYLTARMAAGDMRSHDAHFAAVAFLDMVRGPFRAQALIDGRFDFAATPVSAHVEACVALFLNGVRR
jgi:AcrR family transcriptional regulator